MNDLSKRMIALERQNRNLRIAVTMIGCGLLVTVAAAAASRPNPIQESIRARRIELVDEDGQPLVVLEGADGKGKISTRTAGGGKLVELGTDASGAGNLAVFGVKGTAIVTAGHDATHGNGVFARNGGENICASLVASPKGHGAIVVSNHDDQTVGWLVGNEQGGSLFLNDAQGGSLVIATAAAGKGTMLLKNQDGKIVSRLPPQ